MIIRTVDVIMVAALLGAAAWTFKVKNDSEAALARIETLERQIEREREAIDLLRADWSLLTSPDRLEKLVRRHHEELQLEPARPDQTVTLQEIPYPPAENPSDSRNAAIEDHPDRDIQTGSIAAPTANGEEGE